MTLQSTAYAAEVAYPTSQIPPKQDLPYTYPSIPVIQSPPTAYLQHGKRFSQGQKTDETRVQSSFSSASGSSGTSYQKRKTPSPDSQWPSPTLEQTLVNSDQYYNSQSTTQWHRSGTSKGSHIHGRPETRADHSPPLTYIHGRRDTEQNDNDDDDDDEEEDHALWVLFWLSALDPIHSFFSCIFTMIVTVGLILALPIRLVHKQSSFGDQVIRTVAPMFKNHLELMHATSVDYAHEWDFIPGRLVLMHILSPLISIGVAIASWVTAAFWVFAYIMGNPDGTERRDDGRDAVLAVRNWWERCLLTATRPRSRRPAMRSIV